MSGIGVLKNIFEIFKYLIFIKSDKFTEIVNLSIINFSK